MKKETLLDRAILLILSPIRSFLWKAYCLANWKTSEEMTEYIYVSEWCYRKNQVLPTELT